MENAGRVSKRAVHYLILTCAWGFVICMYSSPSKYQLPIQIRANVLLIYGLRFSNIRQQAYIHTLNLYIYICIQIDPWPDSIVTINGKASVMILLAFGCLFG